MPAAKRSVDLVIVGSVGIDGIETPLEKREELLGGSASYACAAASFFTSVGMVAVVGTDFPKSHRTLFDRFEIDTEGLQVVSGKTFRWAGVYEQNMDHRRTLLTELNVFATFSPELPASYVRTPFLFLGNISPSLQLHVLDQVRKPRFVLLDTMDLWISETRADLLKVIGRVDMLTLNESEARHLTGEHTLLSAAHRLIELGPKYVLIKKGENGSMLFSRKGIFIMPAFPLEHVKDPTGAGDTFAGGLLGSLAAQGRVTESTIRQAMLHGSVVASFGVEDFSLDRLRRLKKAEITRRAAQLRGMMSFG